MGPASPPAVVSFAASSSTVAPGTAVTLSWQTVNATGVTIDNGVGGQPANGSVSVKPTVTTTYTLIAQGANGQSSAPAMAKVTVSKNAPSVQLTATPNPVRAGASLTMAWTTTNAVAISFNPSIPPQEDTGFALPSGSDTFLAPQSGNTTQTINYVATVTGADGTTATGSVMVQVQPPLPTISFSAKPTALVAGQAATLTWTTQNAASFSIDNGVGNNLPATGTANVTPQTTTTYTATAVGGDGTKVTAAVTINVSSITLTANPQSVLPGQATTLTWTSPNANQVTIDNGIGQVQPASGGSVQTQPLTSTTTFTATATATNGTTATASVTVTVSPLAGLENINHIIFFVQENRSFDNYFSQLGAYKASRGFNNDVNLDYNPNVQLTGIQGIKVSPYHERTERTHNLTPAWNESHFDIHTTNGNYQCTPLPNSNCQMDRYMLTTKSIPEGLATDPNGDRAMGYYDQTDLPFYHELAAQFATSDTWFSPVLANTVPNRQYLFSATSQGNIFPPSSSTVGQFNWPTIFDAMTKAGITWRYYYIDNSVFLSQWATWNNPAEQGNVRSITEYFNILAGPNADTQLPQVVFIERGGASGLDEHPEENIQLGAAQAQRVINALLSSAAWRDSAFILTFDEGGGVYDHVPPFNEVPPDNIPPKTGPNDAKAEFNQSGFRVPLIVISPWTRPHFVSHVNRDTTAILKLIETRFNVPPLTARDAAQDPMVEFFDFSNTSAPPSLNAPGGGGWAPFLPVQPTNGTDNVNRETAP